MNIKDYTTDVPAGRSQMEIEHLLVEAGAVGIQKVYENGKVTAFYFAIPVNQTVLTFRMPADVEAVYQTLQKAKLTGHASKSREQAERVAWRILKDWTLVQLTLILVKKQPPQQAFFAYIWNPLTQKTFYETVSESQFAALKSGAEDGT